MLRNPMTITRAFPSILLVALAACSAPDVVSMPENPATDLFWAVRINAKPVTVAVGESYQLIARSYQADGKEAVNLPKPVFRSVDSTRVDVDSTGLVTGRKETAGINIIASLTVNGVTKTDMTPVAVTAVRYAVKSFKMESAFGGAVPSVVPVGGAIPISVVMKDSLDAPIPGNAISVAAVDNRIVSGSPYSIFGNALGKTKVVATATSYGKMYTDTIEVGTIYSTQTTVYFCLGCLSPSAVVLGVGGSVTWNNNSYLKTPANIKFDKPDKVTGGDVPIINYMEQVTRSFPNVGVYNYTNTLSGAKGTIYVREQPTY